MLYVVITTHNGLKNHVFPYVYTTYLVLTTVVFPRKTVPGGMQ